MAVRIARLGVGRQGILNPTTANVVDPLWRDWSATIAKQAARCARLAAAVAQGSWDYRVADSSIAGDPVAPTHRL